MADLTPSNIYYVLTPHKEAKPGEDIPSYYVESFVDLVEALFYYRDCLQAGQSPLFCQHLGVTLNGKDLKAKDLNGRGGRVKV